jgi:hypothetical protein
MTKDDNSKETELRLMEKWNNVTSNRPPENDDGAVDDLLQKGPLSNSEIGNETGLTSSEGVIASDKADIATESEDLREGGYGWVVVAAAFMGRFMNTGSIFGLFFVQLVDCFGRPRGETALVGSICFGTSMLAGKCIDGELVPVDLLSKTNPWSSSRVN